MSLHYIDPNDEPRECPSCEGVGYRHIRQDCDGTYDGPENDCPGDCNGTGRLGDPEKRAEIDVFLHDKGDFGEEWGWVGIAERCCLRFYDTESEALAAARKALKGEK